MRNPVRYPKRNSAVYNGIDIVFGGYLDPAWRSVIPMLQSKNFAHMLLNYKNRDHYCIIAGLDVVARFRKVEYNKFGPVPRKFELPSSRKTTDHPTSKDFFSISVFSLFTCKCDLVKVMVSCDPAHPALK